MAIETTDSVIVDRNGVPYKTSGQDVRDFNAYGLSLATPTDEVPNFLNDKIRAGDGVTFETLTVGVLGDDGTTSLSDRLWVHVDPKRHLIQKSGRAVANTDARWVTDSDDNYGSAYHHWSESSGTGVEPIYEWEHLGMYVPAGTTLDKLTLLTRANNVQVTDYEIRVVIRRPSTYTAWETGFDHDNEMDNEVLFTGNFWDSGTMLGNMTDLHRKVIEFHPSAADLAADPTLVGTDPKTFNLEGMLSIYFKPIGTMSARRYLRTTLTWEFLA